MEQGLKEKVRTYLTVHQMICPGETVAVALSGGKDSVCLLGLMEELRQELSFELCAVHVNHGLRAVSEEEEKWVRDLCEKKGIPLFCETVNVKVLAAEKGLSIEEAARELRYQVFEKVKTDKIALAHHSQDQAETFLQRMLRGSGLRGLGGMHPVRGRYIRPLLEVEPAQLQAYNEKRGQDWMEDASNKDVRYERNHIRHDLLPYLEQHYHSSVIKILTRTAQTLRQDEECLELLAEQHYASVVCESGLRCRELNVLHPAIAIRVIRRFLEGEGLKRDLQKEHWEGILQLARNEHGRKITLPGGLTLCRSYDILTNHKDAISAGWENITLPEAGEIFLPDGSGKIIVESVLCPKRDTLLRSGPEEEWMDISYRGRLVLRTRRSGDYIIASGGRRRLQDFFVDKKVPAAERDHIWLLADGDHVVWIIGHRLSDGARISQASEKALHLRLQKKF